MCIHAAYFISVLFVKIYIYNRYSFFKKKALNIIQSVTMLGVRNSQNGDSTGGLISFCPGSRLIIIQCNSNPLISYTFNYNSINFPPI